MSVAGRGFELAKSPRTEVLSSILLYPHGARRLLQPQGHAGSGPLTTTSGCEEADLPPWLMGLEPRAIAPASRSLPTSLHPFLCRSLNGATDIREFPDLKGTTSLEVL